MDGREIHERTPWLGEQAPYPIGAGGFCGEVLVEASQHLGGNLAGQLQQPQDMGHRPGGVRDDRGVLRVGFRLSRGRRSASWRARGDLAARVPGRQSGAEHRSARGWSTVTSTVPNFAVSLSNTARSYGSLLGIGLSKTLFPGSARGRGERSCGRTSRGRRLCLRCLTSRLSAGVERAGLCLGAVLAHPRHADLLP